MEVKIVLIEQCTPIVVIDGIVLGRWLERGEVRSIAAIEDALLHVVGRLRSERLPDIITADRGRPKR